MFAHLHCHFIGSWNDGLLDFSGDLDFLASAGHRAVAITDHGDIGCAYEFWRACRRRGLHPVIGCECYFVEDARRSLEEGSSERFHLILLARTQEGFGNLIRLNNASWLENNYREIRGLVDWKLLERYGAGLSALSACFWGSLPQACLRGGLEAGRRELKRYLDIFGREFYLEFQDHGIADEGKANRMMAELNRSFGCGAVVTNDCHYRLDGDWRAHDVLIKTRFGKPSTFELQARDYSLKSEERMRSLGFPDEWYARAVDLAFSCEVDLSPGPRLPEPEETGSPRVYWGVPRLLSPAQAVRDTAQVLGDEFLQGDDFRKRFPADLSLRESVARDPVLSRHRESNPILYELAEKLVGAGRGVDPDKNRPLPASLEKLRETVPLRRSRGALVTQFAAPASPGENSAGPLTG
ncbi:MAG TPA: PHP domain-containing protein [bacterium]|nr:PHP domain-containing protein [bacterium]HPJ71694.1 PHP domain-containing protein [bacterium]HPQ66910.1 PHP domain-containing protein [bacterium]